MPRGLDVLAEDHRLCRRPLGHRVQSRLVEAGVLGNPEIRHHLSHPLSRDRTHVAGLRDVGHQHLREAGPEPVELRGAGGVGEGQNGQSRDRALDRGGKLFTPFAVEVDQSTGAEREKDRGGDERRFPLRDRPLHPKRERAIDLLPVEVFEDFRGALVAKRRVHFHALQNDALEIGRDLERDLPRAPEACG